MSNTTEYNKIDYTTICIYAALVIFGWMNVYAACYSDLHPSIFDFSVQHGKQLIWVGIAAITATIIMLVDPRIFTNGCYIFYIIVMALLVLTLIIGRSVNGGTSWIEIGPIRLQPTEFSKFATALMLSKLVSRHDFDMRQTRNWVYFLLIMALPMGLIFLQNDTGSVLVFLAFLLPLYRFGLTPKIFIIGLIIVLLFVLSLAMDKFQLIFFISLLLLFYLFAWIGKPQLRHYLIALALLIGCSLFVFSVDYCFHKFLKDYQQERVLVMLNPAIAPNGIGYNVNQAKITIGSGQLIGKGYLQGTSTRARFVPEQETDFIFCTVGEEWGFVGSAALLLVYLWLLQRIISMSERQASVFGRFYGYSVAAIFFFHIAVNIGMVIGWMPVIGIPLPFFSYGGSSLVAFTILLFILIRMDATPNELY